MTNQPLEMLQRRLTRLKEMMPLLPEDERMDPMDALILELSVSARQARQEKNPELATMFEERIKLAKTL